MALVLLAVAVLLLPGGVNCVAYLTDAAPRDTFTALHNYQNCAKGQCSLYTVGVLKHTGQQLSYPYEVQPGSSILVRAPVWDPWLGTLPGTGIIADTGDAVDGTIIEGFLLAICIAAFSYLATAWRAALRRGTRSG